MMPRPDFDCGSDLPSPLSKWALPEICQRIRCSAVYTSVLVTVSLVIQNLGKPQLSCNRITLPDSGLSATDHRCLGGHWSGTADTAVQVKPSYQLVLHNCTVVIIPSSRAFPLVTQLCIPLAPQLVSVTHRPDYTLQSYASC